MRLRRRDGQFMIESILVMILMLAVMLVITRYIRDNGTVTKMVTGPWEKLAGMTEFGVWGAPAADTRKKHPNTFNRFYTPSPTN